MGIFFSQISSFADPGILFGGVGVPDQSDIKKKEKKKKKKKKNTLTVFFCCFVVFFLVHSLLFTEMVNFIEVYLFSRFQRRSNIFQWGGGSNFF